MINNKWIRLLVFLPIPIVMIVINYLVDPGGIFSNDNEEIAKSIVNGNKTLFFNGNVNEREVKHYLIKNMPEQVECIAVGPSLVMGVRKNDVGTESFYNLGESGADMYDIFAQFGLMQIYHKKFDRVVFCVDSYFFDETLNKTLILNKGLKPYAEYMLAVVDGKDVAKPDEKSLGLTNYSELISPSYFKSSLDLIKRRGKSSLTGDRWIKVDGDVYEQGYYMPDGSWVYGLKIQRQDDAYVIDHSNKYDIKKQFSKGKHLGNYPKDSFEKLLMYLLAHNIQVELYLCPIAPALWDRIDTPGYYVMNELESYAHEVAAKYGLKITGSYNPYNLGMTNADFYDSRHVRHELLSKYFDFKP